jgi:DeoR/GlpR family transcriptional regulator of sugar metabolism
MHTMDGRTGCHCHTKYKICATMAEFILEGKLIFEYGRIWEEVYHE